MLGRTDDGQHVFLPSERRFDFWSASSDFRIRQSGTWSDYVGQDTIDSCVADRDSLLVMARSLVLNDKWPRREFRLLRVRFGLPTSTVVLRRWSSSEGHIYSFLAPLRLI